MDLRLLSNLALYKTVKRQHTMKFNTRRTYGYAGIDMRVFGYEVADDRESLVIFVVNAEENFIVGVLLSERRLQILVKVRIKALEWS